MRALLAVAIPLALALGCSGEGCGRGSGGRPDVGADGGAARPDARHGRAVAEAGPLELATPLSRPRPPAGPRFLGIPDDEILAAIGTRKAIGARGTSGTSLSMYLNLEGDLDGAYKPRTKRGQKWSGEVVAYRLARLLEVGRVPPCVSRRFRLSTLEALLEDEPEVLERLRAQAMLVDSNFVVGALSYWVPSIHEAEVDQEEELPRWTAWLRQDGAIPPEKLWLARQLSDTIAFDYVTGNWDRWSGGNVLLGPDKRTLLIMDNNAAFNVNMSKGHAKRLEAALLQVERYSAGLYRRLVALSEEDIRAELAQDPDADLLLHDDQLAAIVARRDRVLERIESLIREHGRDEVLCFP